MTLKELIRQDFNVNLDISGGLGNSIQNPVIIHRTEINDYLGTEHFILKCLGKGRKVEWKILGQELLNHNNKNIDKIKIETKEITEYEIITQIENYYFDITECLGNNKQEKSSFNENDTLKKISKRLAELEEMSDFNKKCIDLIRKGELFNDTKLTLAFMKVILKDESLPLFNSMMSNKRKPIMEVIRIVGKELNENHS